MPLVVLQPRAKADLSEIWDFIADDSDEQADAFVDLLDQKFQLLARQTLSPWEWQPGKSRQLTDQPSSVSNNRILLLTGQALVIRA